jgi:hypothetical protein
LRRRRDDNDDLHSPLGSLRLWVAMAVVFLIVIFIAIGQLDLALAAFIGLILGNGLKALFGR